MNLYHLSHTDLDGYTCQYISSKYFDNSNYYNSNYGEEISSMLALILREIEISKEDSFILITDLNLNIKQCQELDNEIKHLIGLGIKVKLQLLDHHKSGAESAKMFNWYVLDNSRSATKITYDYFVENYENRFSKSQIKFINSVNAADIWLEKDENFEFGKVGLSLISNSREINRYMFNKESFAYYTHLINEATQYVDLEASHIALDNALHEIRKKFLNKNGIDDTLENLKSSYVTALLVSKKSDLQIEYKGHIGIVTFALGNISVLANRFLKENQDIDFFLDVSLKGGISLRADNNADVSKISKELFNGGGHANASGGKFEDFKDSYDYISVKTQIEDLILSKI